jgi:hypothetical protein
MTIPQSGFSAQLPSLKETMNMFSKKILGAVAGSALALASSSALAALDVQGAFQQGTNTFSDDSGLTLIGLDGAGNIQVGSTVIGVVGINTFPTTGADAGAYNELTAIYALEVTAINAAIPCSFFFGTATAASCSSLDFGASSDFNAAMGALGLGGFTNINGDPLDPDTMAILFEDPSQDFVQSSLSVAASAASAANGTQRMTLTDVDNLTGLLPSGVGDLGLLVGEILGGGVFGGAIGSFGGSLGILEESFSNYDFAPTINVSGNYLLPDPAESGWLAHDDATFTTNLTFVSEPGMLGLMGLGLLGFGAAARRQRRS